MVEEPEKNRIREIVDVVEQAMAGDLSLRIEKSGKNDDTDRLADAINRLLHMTDDLISGGRETESALWACKERYRRLKANIPGMVYLFAMHPDGTFSFPYVNDASKQLFDISPDDLMRDVTRITRLIHPDDREKCELSVKRSAEKLLPWREVLRHIVNGEVRWYDCMSRPEVQRNGDILWDGIILEITERKRAEAALKESERRFRELVENLNDIIFSVDVAGLIGYVSPPVEGILGYRVSELVGRHFQSLVHSDDLHRVEESFQVILENQAVVSEFRFQAKSGHYVWMSASGRPILQGERVVGISGVATDITERKLAETALKDSELRLRTVVESMPVLMDAFDDDGNVVVWNKECERVTGYLQEEMLQNPDALRLLYPDEDYRHRVESTLERNAKDFKNVEFLLTSKDGRERIISWSNISTDIPIPRWASWAIGIDVTDEKLMEEALQAERSQLLSIFDSIDALIYVVDPMTYELVFMNKYAQELFGRDPVGKSCYKVLHGLTDPCDFCLEQTNMQLQGRPYKREHHSEILNRYLITTNRMIKWPDGRDVKLGISFDITERKALEDQLLKAQKIEAVGTLAGGIAHDFNNLLQVIQGCADLGLLNLRSGQTGHSELMEVKKAVKQAAELTTGLLTFSRKVEGKLRPVDLNRELVQISKILERTIPKMIAIDLRLAGDLRSVKADPGQLHQTVMNLAVNARDAMPQGGKLVIETANVHLDPEYCRSHLGAKPGIYVLMSVSDTGCGMDKETQHKVFDPFFTTKAVGKGTGLGLSIVFGIVKSHDAHITCYSEPGVGTSFKIHFPAINEAREDLEEVESDRLVGGTETILLVDDEDAVRRFGETMLQTFGYSVLTASNGIEALEVFREQQEEISLVILDLIMPKMGGRECLREILKIHPTVKVLIAGGYGADGQIDDALHEGAKTSIRKPYEARELLKTVREVLDGNRT